MHNQMFHPLKSNCFSVYIAYNKHDLCHCRITCMSICSIINLLLFVMQAGAAFIDKPIILSATFLSTIIELVTTLCIHKMFVREK